MKRLIIITLLFVSMSVTDVFAQGKLVTGTITDEQGPVVGASVTEKDLPSNGTVTTDRGAFSLSLRSSSNIIVVTSVNHLRREINVDNTPLAISLVTDPKALENIVVVGYGRQKKVTVTGSVSTISGQSIRQNPSASIQNGLVGKLPGFSSQQRSGRPGADGAGFYIRGVSSFTGTNAPLIIVDDIEYSYDQFSLIDPNEIENLSILKDASTTAVYGIKGANGVVVVTTRRGKLGSPKISVRTEFATMEPTVLPKYLNSYNTAVLYNQALINDNNFLPVPNPNLVLRWTPADLQAFQDGSDPIGHPDVDWYAELFRKYSHQTRTNIDISGGTERVKYFASLGYLGQGGILNDFSEGQGFNGNYFNRRFNYRSNLDIKVSKTLDLRVDLYGNTSAVNNPYTVSGPNTGTVNGQKNDAFYEYSSFLSLAPYAYPIKNPDGSWGYSNSQRGNTNYDGNNIIERLTLGGYQRLFNDNMNFNTSANQKLDFITRGLSIKGVVSYASNFNYNRDQTRQNYPSFIYDPVTQKYTVRDNNTYRIQPLGATALYTPRTTRRDLTLQAMVNYDRNFGPHHFYGLALLSRNSKWFSGNTTYNFVPVNFQGISSRIGYDYRQKYLVEFNLGYNGTDRFQADKRYGVFPAVSAGWNIAEEDFFRNSISFVNLLKIRGSFGIVGSDDVGSFGYVYLQEFTPMTTVWNNNNTSLTNFPFNRIVQANFGVSSTPYNNLNEGTLPNNVTWEKARKINLALDLGMFNNKVSGTIEVFRDNRYDILTQRNTVSQVLGVPLPPVNLGKVKNEGYDLELTWRDQIGKNFNFSIRGTYSYAKNTVLNLDEAPPIKPYQARTGRSIGDPLLYKWSGTYYQDWDDILKSPKVTVAGIPIVHPGDLKYEDINGDGQVNEFDQGYFGYPNLPRVNYGLQLQVGYKSLQVSVSFQGTGNFSINGIEESIRAFSANLTDVHANAWTPALGNKASYPSLTLARGISDPGRNSTFWSRSGKYLRLRGADISYSLPKNWLRRLKIEDIRIYVNGNNLFTWSKFFDLYALDPEATPNTDRTIYPPQKVYNVGVSVNF